MFLFLVFIQWPKMKVGKENIARHENKIGKKNMFVLHVGIYLITQITQSVSAIFQCGQKHKAWQKTTSQLNSGNTPTSCNASGRLEITSMAIRIED